MLSSFVLRGLVWLLPIVSLIQSVPLRKWWKEFASNFGGYYLLGHFLALLLLIFYRKGIALRFRKSFVCLHLVLFLKFMMIAWPFYIAPGVDPLIAEVSLKHEFRVFYGNVAQDNPSRRKAIETIVSYKPDLIALVEINESWQRELRKIAQYSQQKIWARSDSFGFAFLSRTPLNITEQVSMGLLIPPIVRTRLKFDDTRALDFILLHARPPLSKDIISMNRVFFRRLSNLYRHNESRLIVAGDFNASVYSKNYQFLLSQTDLRDSAWGQGLQKTWDKTSFLKNFTIDHMLYRGPLKVVKRQVVYIPGSDHAGIVVDFLL